VKCSGVITAGTGYVEFFYVRNSKEKIRMFLKTYQLLSRRWPVYLSWVRVINVTLAVLLAYTYPYSHFVTLTYLVASTDEVVFPLSERFLLQSCGGHDIILDR
jgi:hypothetical protein